MRYLAVLFFASLGASAAFGQTTSVLPYPPQNDTVSMSLAVEDWAETQSARVELGVETALPGSDAGKVRVDMLAAVKATGQNAEWRFTRFDREQDSSGLEHWHATLEARLPEAQLGGLADRARQASKPGLQISVQTVDFTPTLAEVEASRAKLRGEMYKRINEALAQLNQAEPGLKYRIGNINLMWNTSPPPQPRAFTKMAAEVASQEPPIDLSQKVQIRANVTFSAHAPAD